jgi:serine/threonine-protein kinase
MVDPNTIIDARYRVVSRLGSGGMADVYLAEDQLLGRQVAVKLLHRHFAEDQEFVERFRREASSAARLSHPNIVGIFDRGEWNGTYYIAMEYVAGRSLKTIVREQGALPPATAIEIVIQILRAARFAHKRGVIHRDLKPHNVIVDEEGRARVTDFGIARAGASDMTMTGSIMGTAQYLSPEQAQGQPVTAASDVYSVGVILYELLTGVVPFEGETAVAIAFKHVSAEAVPPSVLNPAVPSSLDAVVARALAKDPGDRYPGADDFIAALERERQQIAVTPGAAVLSMPAARHFEVEPSVPLPDAPRRSGRLWWGLGALAVAAVAALAIVLLTSAGRVTVPDVIGQTQQTAVANLKQSGLFPELVDEASATVASGVVLSETPARGSVVAKGTRIRVSVSSGPTTVRVPTVEGLTAAQATASLTGVGLRPSTHLEPDSTIPAGRVISTDPTAGYAVSPHSPVTINVSSGAALVRVPRLTGKSQSAAEAALEALGLTLGTVTQRAAQGQTPETVLSQSPPAGSSLHAEGKVNLVVVPKPAEARVPPLIGEGEAQAAAALEQAGFRPRTETAPTTEQAKVGLVVKQSPSAGRHEPKGTTVTIVIGALSTQTTTTTGTTSTGAAPVPAG